MTLNPDNPETTLLSYEFKVNKKVDVNTETEDSTKTAISMVWNKHVGSKNTFNIEYCSEIVNPNTNEPLDRSAEYNPDTDTFVFAVKTIKERYSFGLPEEIGIILLAAHEAMHKVQFYRGDYPKPSPEGIPQEYFDDPHEQEAWNAALNVFKKIYPNSSGGFTTGNKRYEIPLKSNY